jgi:2-aminoadipate transaminase
MAIKWSDRFSSRTSQVGLSAIREIFKLMQTPGIISFAGGLPAPEMFPIDAVQEATTRVLKDMGSQALQYSTTEGHLPLRVFIADRISCHGIKADEDNILITSGSQQALDLISKVFIDPGECVVVERPTFSAALQTFSSYQAVCKGVDTDEDGAVVSQLEEVIDGSTKFVYIQPNFQNPGGTTLTLERRRELVATSERHGLPIVEDDPYYEFRFGGEDLPLLLELDAQQRPGGRQGDGLGEVNVIRMGTFSKTLAPGLRLGWIVAPRDVIGPLVIAKQAADLHTSILNQMLAYEVIKDGFLEPHVQRLRAIYRERRDVMLSAMDRHLPGGVHWAVPEGGFFLWVTLPERLDASVLLQEAVKQGVAFVPGATFFPEDGRQPQSNTMRLNFSFCTPSVIEEGILRLGRALCRQLEG